MAKRTFLLAGNSENQRLRPSSEKRKLTPCFNHRPWEGKECLKGAECGFLHVNGKDDLPPGWEFRRPKAKAKQRGKKVRPRSGQLFVGTVGKVLLTAAALAGCQSGIQQASSLSVPIAGAGNLKGAFPGDGLSGEFGLSGAGGCRHLGTGLRAEGSHVDFSVADREEYIVEDDVNLHPCGSRRREGNKGTVLIDDLNKKKAFTIDQMLQRCSQESHQQECMNSLIYALSKAAQLAAEVGETGPPDRDEIDEETLMMTSAAGLAALENG